MSKGEYLIGVLIFWAIVGILAYIHEWRKKHGYKRKKVVKYILAGLSLIFAFYLFSTTPAYFYIFGLSANDTCEEFRKAPLKAQVDFIRGCGCLSEKLLDKVIKYDLEDKVQDCFYREIKTCIGGERIGILYSDCAKAVSPYQ